MSTSKSAWAETFAHMLIVTNEKMYYNQRGEFLLSTGSSGFRR